MLFEALCAAFEPGEDSDFTQFRDLSHFNKELTCHRHPLLSRGGEWQFQETNWLTEGLNCLPKMPVLLHRVHRDLKAVMENL